MVGYFEEQVLLGSFAFRHSEVATPYLGGGTVGQCHMYVSSLVPPLKPTPNPLTCGSENICRDGYKRTLFGMVGLACARTFPHVDLGIDEHVGLAM